MTSLPVVRHVRSMDTYEPRTDNTYNIKDVQFYDAPASCS